ncbi:unnamed protein product [Strongylus vulgaris]|uniref:Uncharacterized protein n=1 Tax=Strongylus vulgaris TaxID=40348 RepID=A0A3P7LI56_STRVU|nr:unnamed protein product [Strongylus vulgaris]
MTYLKATAPMSTTVLRNNPVHQHLRRTSTMRT